MKFQSNSKPILDIAIPTYNRTFFLAQTLSSVQTAISYIDISERQLVSVSVHSNSTKDFEIYRELTNSFSERFYDLGVSFRCCTSGVNIGAEQNMLGLFLSSSAKYIWILPDDDLAAPDSVSQILDVVTVSDFSFLLGSFEEQTQIEHSYDYAPLTCLDLSVTNSVHQVFEYPSSFHAFFCSHRLVSLQEMIFNLDLLKKYIHSKEYIDLIDPFLPFTFAVFCLNSKLPLLCYSNSIGLFRKDDPSSPWRHLWFKLLLIDWPRLVRKLLALGLIPKALYKLIYHRMLSDANVFFALSARIDILSGINQYYKVNPLLALCSYPVFVIRALMFSPINLSRHLLRKAFNLR